MARQVSDLMKERRLDYLLADLKVMKKGVMMALLREILKECSLVD